MNFGNFTSKMRGEYRARLYDYKGRLKSDTGWKPNLILNRAPYLLLDSWGRLQSCTIGTSNAAADGAQTGLQGSKLATAQFGAGSRITNYVTPPYWYAMQCPVTFGVNVGTGTINEYVIHASYEANSEFDKSVIRVVLDAPIVKGASDELMIEHRLYMYPDISTKTGIVSINGEDYNYKFQLKNLDQALAFTNNYFNDVLRRSVESPGAVEVWNPISWPVDIFDNPYPQGTAPTYPFGGSTGFSVSDVVVDDPVPYRQVNLVANIDRCNCEFNGISFLWLRNTIYNQFYGLVLEIDKVNGGGGFNKERTHELSFYYRLYLDKYTL